jgi:hypothetical protein
MNNTDIYLRTKDANNPSERLQRFFKKYKQVTIWARGEDRESIKSIRSKSLKEMRLIIGSPGMEGRETGKKAVKYKTYCGWDIPSITTHNTIPKYRCVIGYGVNCGGVWFVDVTEKFIEEYNKFGRCAIHDFGHEFLYPSARIKQCKFCHKKYKKKIIIKKSIEWNPVK